MTTALYSRSITKAHLKDLLRKVLNEDNRVDVILSQGAIQPEDDTWSLMGQALDELSEEFFELLIK